MALGHTAWWHSMPSPAALEVLTARQPWDWGGLKEAWEHACREGRGVATGLSCWPSDCLPGPCSRWGVGPLGSP